MMHPHCVYCGNNHSPFMLCKNHMDSYLPIPKENFISTEFAAQTIAVMESNNAWFISELDRLTRKAIEATKELAEHRQYMVDRETIITKLKEMTQ